jgi:serine/threonine protein kinase
MLADYVTNPIGSGSGLDIGGGGSSKVRLARDPETRKPIVIKYIPFSDPARDRMTFMREIESLVALNHPCVLRIVHWARPGEKGCGEIHTEYAEEGSLEDVLGRLKRKTEKIDWSPTQIGIAICDMVLGMRYVHSQGIVHRDLKPSNVFIRGNGRALIGDCGSSRFESDEGTLTATSTTCYYAAPELFDEDAILTPAVDVWAFGLILYEVFAGSAVFPISLSPFDIIRQLRRHQRPTIPTACGDYMVHLIGRCWSDNPSRRPSFGGILREFREMGFAILPGVDRERIRRVVEDVLEWEGAAGVRQT